eukprot:15348554-Ditylum_brightwellii.AAC.1
MDEMAVPIWCQEIVNIHGDVLTFAKQLEDILGEKEMNFLKEGIKSRAILEPQLLIKDHMNLRDNEHYQTPLVIPAMNFAATFSKIGYLGIRKILDDNNANYVKHTITQASHLKEQLDQLNLQCEQVTIMSLSVVNMYPSIFLLLIKKAMQHYSRNLSRDEKKKIEWCMK